MFPNKNRPRTQHKLNQNNMDGHKQYFHKISDEVLKMVWNSITQKIFEKDEIIAAQGEECIVYFFYAL